MSRFWEGFIKRAEDNKAPLGTRVVDSATNAAPMFGALAGGLTALGYAEKAKARTIPAGLLAGLAALGGHHAGSGVSSFVNKLRGAKKEGLPKDYGEPGKNWDE